MKAPKNGLRTIALLEAFKGGLALIAALGIHELTGVRLQQIIETLATHLHLNPAKQEPSILLSAGTLTDAQLTLLAAGAVIYALIRFIEAYGLWRGMRWTEWFALVSGAIYLPAELYELYKDTNMLTVGILAINIAVVWYMTLTLLSRRKASSGDSVLISSREPSNK